ncbi:hypothetical protein LTR48_008176, partial [Friedmanniomyces endolithicus]
MSIKSIIRFVDAEGRTCYGEPTIESLSKPLEGANVEVLSGDPFTGLSRTGSHANVGK